MISAKAITASHQKNNVNIKLLLLVIFFFTLGIGLFCYIKNSEANGVLAESVSQQNEELTTAERQIRKLESGLDSTNRLGIQLSTSFEAKKTELLMDIVKLRLVLHQSAQSEEELVEVKRKISALQASIFQLTEKAFLETQNSQLALDNANLRSTAALLKRKTSALEKVHAYLVKKASQAASLKTETIIVTPVKVKASGKEVSVSNFSKVNKIRISFTLKQNSLTKQGVHKVYLMLKDSKGDVHPGDDSDPVESSNGEDLDYTSCASILYQRTIKAYTIEWKNDDDLEAGIYTAVLYSDGYPMGSTTFRLRKGGLFN